MVRYDLLFLFAYALAFAGAYLLARELGLGPGGAAVAGAAFAFAPFRLEQDGHMQVISSGGIPLAFALGLRGYRLRRPAWVVAAWAVAAWQLSIGFTLGLPLAYLLAALWLIAAVVWLRRGRPRLDRGLAVATVAGAAIFVAAGFAAQPARTCAWPTRTPTRSARRPTSRRSRARRGSSSSRPDENLVWGGATAPLRDGLENVPEKTLFPGLVILALAIAGLASPAYPALAAARARRRGRASCPVLALGFQAKRRARCGRTASSTSCCPAGRRSGCPGRLVTFSSLGLALLAGAGAAAS